MTYACTTWGFAADAYLLILQLLQNKVLRTIRNFQRCTLVHNLQTAFNLPYVYNYTWCGQNVLALNFFPQMWQHFRLYGGLASRGKPYKSSFQVRLLSSVYIFFFSSIWERSFFFCVVEMDRGVLTEQRTNIKFLVKLGKSE
jgi:hypothetical protein